MLEIVNCFILKNSSCKIICSVNNLIRMFINNYLLGDLV